MEATHEVKQKSVGHGKGPVAPEPNSSAGLHGGGAEAGIPLFLQGAFPSGPALMPTGDPGTTRATFLVQTKLVIGPPGDAYEQEADRIADLAAQRSAVPAPIGQHTDSHRIQRSCEGCSEDAPCAECEEKRRKEEGEGTIQRKPLPSSGSPNISGLPTGSGQPLSRPVRQRLEPVLGVDLGHVQVHADSSAQEAAAALQAKAFTHGSHIWLGSGQSTEDTKLLAHEAAHVVQQTAGPSRVQMIQRKPNDTGPINDGEEVRRRMQQRINDEVGQKDEEASTEGSSQSQATAPAQGGATARPDAAQAAHGVDRAELKEKRSELQPEAHPSVDRAAEEKPHVDRATTTAKTEVDSPPNLPAQLGQVKPAPAAAAPANGGGGAAGRGAAGPGGAPAAGAGGAAGADAAAAAAGAAAAATAGGAGAGHGAGGAAGGGAQAAASHAANLVEQAFSQASVQPPPVPSPPVVPPPLTQPVDAKGAPLPGDPQGDMQVQALADQIQVLRDGGLQLRRHAMESRTNAHLLQGNIGLIQSGIQQAGDSIHTSQDHLTYRRGVVTKAEQALGVSEQKATNVAEQAPQYVDKANEGKEKSGPMASEAGQMANENKANTPDDDDAAENAQEQGSKLNQVSSDSTSVDDAIGQAQGAAGTLVQDAAKAKQTNTNTRTKLDGAHEMLGQTEARLGQMRGQTTQAHAQVTALSHQPAVMLARADALDMEGTSLIEASHDMEARLRDSQSSYLSGMQSVPGIPEPAAGGGPETVVQRQEAEAPPINIAEGVPSWLTGEDEPTLQQRQQQQLQEQQRRQQQLDEINQLSGGHFERLSAGDKMNIAIRQMGRNLFGGLGHISWPGWGAVGRGAGKLALGLIDPRGPLMGVVGGVNMIVNGVASFVRHPSWGGALKMAADIATGLTIILGSITALAGVIIAIMTAITILSFGTAAPVTGPIIAFCATVMSTVGGWTLTVGSIALLLQELVFIKNLYEAATAQTAEELQHQSDNLTQDVRSAGNVVLQMGMAKLAQVGGRNLQSAIEAEGGGVAFAAGMGARSAPGRIVSGIRSAGGVRAYAGEVATGLSESVSSAGGVGRFALQGVRSVGSGVKGFVGRTWHELTSEAPAGLSAQQGFSRNFLVGEKVGPGGYFSDAWASTRAELGEAGVLSAPRPTTVTPEVTPTAAPSAQAPTATTVETPPPPAVTPETPPPPRPTAEAPATPPPPEAPTAPARTETPPPGEAPVNASEAQMLDNTANKTGASLSREELSGELNIVNRAEARPIREGPYVEEVDLPNGHKWRETEGGVWCRFSPGPPDCFVPGPGGPRPAEPPPTTTAGEQPARPAVAEGEPVSPPPEPAQATGTPAVSEGRYQAKDLADVQRLRENPPTRPVDLPAGEEARWQQYTEYYNEYLDQMEGQLKQIQNLEGRLQAAEARGNTKLASSLRDQIQDLHDSVAPPRTWESYRDFRSQFGARWEEGREFQGDFTEHLREQRGQGVVVEQDVGLAKRGGGTTKYADQLVYDPAQNEVEAFSNKQRDFASIKDVPRTVENDVREALNKYGGTVEVRRPTTIDPATGAEVAHPLYGEKVKITKVTLVYDGDLVPASMRPNITELARAKAASLYKTIKLDVIFWP